MLPLPKVAIPKVAAVIPCFRVTGQVLDVIARIGPEVDLIFAVDDCCPDGSGDLVESRCTDHRVRVLRHEQNKGVGGAMVTGYRAALQAGADIVVKLDGDGQMDPSLLPDFVAPLAALEADYVKGNRFFTLHGVRSMPKVRLFGNAVLSFMTKLSSGYWSVFDPTNGYTAIHAAALRRIDLSRLAERYFFESDLLIRLGSIRAVVLDLPMDAVYGDEASNLRIGAIAPEFLRKHCVETVKRIVYWYFIRDFSLASLNLVLGLLLTGFGVIFGAVAWHASIIQLRPATTGTVILAALPIMLGVQMLLSFLAVDIGNVPRTPLCRLARRQSQPSQLAHAS